MKGRGFNSHSVQEILFLGGFFLAMVIFESRI
jgi:hypothetical protein